MNDSIGINLKAIKILIHTCTWFAPILAPFIIYLIFKDEEIQRLSLQAIVFHIACWVLIGIFGFLSIFIVGIPFLIITGIIYLITPIVGIVYAINDRYFSYPIVGRFIH